VEDRGLRDKIFKLFQTCQVALDNVYAINLSSKTKKANAFVCGIGKGRRVCLSDTLISEFSPSEIEVVVAHELGHLKHKDIFKLLIVNALIILTGLFWVNKILKMSVNSFSLKAIDDISFFPVLAFVFVIFGFLTTPLLNGYSRFIEKKADQFSIEITKKPLDFISTMNKLGKMNLSEINPSRTVEIFFYDHPPINKRIAFAKSFIS